MSEQIKCVTMPEDQWAEYIEEAGRRVTRLTAALALLREVEWSGYQDGDPCCPVCRGYNPDPLPPRCGHAPDCRLAALLVEPEASG